MTADEPVEGLAAWLQNNMGILAAYQERLPGRDPFILADALLALPPKDRAALIGLDLQVDEQTRGMYGPVVARRFVTSWDRS